jgi:hypothetical protein
MASVPVWPRSVPSGDWLIVWLVVVGSHRNLDPSLNVLSNRPLVMAGLLPRWRGV